MPSAALRNAPVLHRDEHLTVLWLERYAALMNTWTGFLQGDEFRSRMGLCLELLQRASATVIVANVQQFRPIVGTDQEWSNDVWGPRAIEAGLRRMVVVLPLNVFSQLTVTRVVQRLGESSLHVTQVAEVNDALRWLEVPQVAP